MRADLQGAADHLDTYGYCVLEDRIKPAMAESMAGDFLALHSDPALSTTIDFADHYQTLFGMLNLDDRVWDCAGHEDVVAIARSFLGERCRVVEACSKPSWPGAPAQPLHVDSAGHFHTVPDVPWMINTIWMLTDFTEENGGTGVVPMSHRSRRSSPPAALSGESPLVKTVTGRAGSVLLWHAGAYHGAGANRSSQVRHGLNVAYYPRWFNNWIENGHQPIWPETYERMPAEMRRLCPGRLGKRRDEAYETRRDD